MSFSFCQGFSWFFASPKKFGRKFRGEILKFEVRNLEDYSPKFAVKPHVACKPLNFNRLQKCSENGRFCQYFLSILPYVAIHRKVNKVKKTGHNLCISET